MKYALRALTVELVNIHFTVFIFILILIWLNYLRFSFISFTAGNWDGNLILFSGGVLINILIFTVYRIIKIIFHRLLKVEKDFIKNQTLYNNGSIQSNNIVDPYATLDSFRQMYRPSIKKSRKHVQNFQSPDQKSLFFFGRPRVLFPMIQTTMLLSAFYVGMFIYYSISTHVPWYWWIFYSLQGLALISFIPALLFSLVKVMYTGQMADYHLLLKASEKQMLRQKSHLLRFRDAMDNSVLVPLEEEHEEIKKKLTSSIVAMVNIDDSNEDD